MVLQDREWTNDVIQVMKEFQGICGSTLRLSPEEFSEALGMPGKNSKQFQ